MLQVKLRVVTLRITDWAWISSRKWGNQIFRGTSLEREVGPHSEDFCHRSFQKKSTDGRIQWNPDNTDIKRSYCPWTGCPY